MLWAPAGLERQLDEFYVGLLKFEREEIPGDDASELVYRAENFRVRIQVLERPVPREDFRPLTLVVDSVNDLGSAINRGGNRISSATRIGPGSGQSLVERSSRESGVDW